MEPENGEVFVARQPVFNRASSVIGYRLLFGDEVGDLFQKHEEKAALKVIGDTFFLLGVDAMTGGKRALVTVPHSPLVAGYATLLPRNLTIVEVPSIKDPDHELVDACRRLRAAGYVLALGGLDIGTEANPLLSVVDMIRVDIRQLRPQDRKLVVQLFAPRRIKLLAEAVQSQEEFAEASAMGYDHFQGEFFSAPTIISGKDLPAFKVNHLQLLKEINAQQMDFKRMEEVIKREVSLSYKLMRYINSAWFGLRKEVSNVRHAMLMLGEAGIRKWASVVVMTELVLDKPFELMTASVLRAKFCESIAEATGLKPRAGDLFLLGLFSLMDAIVGRPLAEILDGLPIAEDVKAALLGERNGLSPVYELVLAYEKGSWIGVFKAAKELGLSGNEMPAIYRQAVEWSQVAAA